MADMMMAAGIDAAGDIDVQPPDQVGGVVVGEAPRQFLRDRDRARIGQRAIIQPRAGDDVGDQVDVRRGDADLVERLPQRRQVAPGDMGQRQILLVADADFAERIFVGEIGDARPSGRRWRRPAGRPPASATASRSHSPAPCAGTPSSCASASNMRIMRRLLQLVRHVRQLFVGRIGEARADVLDHGIIDRAARCRASAAILPRLPWRTSRCRVRAPGS